MPWIVVGNLVLTVGEDTGAGEPETGSAGLVCFGTSKSRIRVWSGVVDHVLTCTKRCFGFIQETAFHGHSWPGISRNFRAAGER